MTAIVKTTEEASLHTETVKSGKFGTFSGVFVPCLLMLFGVVIFLRLGWVVGMAGLPKALFIITMATVIALISTLSMAAIATNIQVGKGGVYYILSRSLGLEIGSAVGIPLYLKQVLSIAFCVVGFSESLHDLLPYLPIRDIGLFTLIILTIIAYTSVKGALKVQILILGLMVLSFISLFYGGDLTPMHPDTFTPNPIEKLGFWILFAIFFPAMTGVESVVSLSGDLKDPSRSLPLGAISATIVAYIAYIAVAVFLVQHAPLDRLRDDPLILQDLAWIPSLIILGIWGATLSSALGGLLGAPRTLQAMSYDGVLPKFISKGLKGSTEPHIATILTFAITFVCIYFGSINAIAPLMTMICLVCYGALNVSAGIETLIANPSWRPTFPVHWALSITGAILCLFCMLMIDVEAALISLAMVIILYVVVKRFVVKTSWEDIREGFLLYLSRYAMYSLAKTKPSSRAWRPHFLVFSKASSKQSIQVLRVFQSISQSKGFVTIASFLTDNTLSRERKYQLADIISTRLLEKNIQSFVHIRESKDPTEEMLHMIKHYGLGPLSPNTIVFGTMKDSNRATEFVKVVQAAHTQQCNVIIMSEDKRVDPSVDKSVKNGEIHIWWDDEYEENSELMMVLSYMLQRQFLINKNKICIKSIIPNERAKQSKISQFDELSKKLRVTLDIEIYVSKESSDEEVFNFVKLFSQKAQIIFLSLKPPPIDDELQEEYAKYLSHISKSASDLQDVAMVLSSEHTPLEKILQ